VDWDDLRYLLAVHRRGTLAAAAKELQVTKATMSRRLAALEQSSRVRLLERKPNGLTLTAAGREAVAAAEEVARAVEGLEARLALSAEDIPRGTVRFTAPPWLAARFIIPKLPELKTRYPELDVQLVGTNEIVNLAQRDADLALRNVRPTHASLVARKVGTLGGCVYGSTLYLQRKGRPTDRASLRAHDLLGYAGLGGMPGFEWMAEAPYAAAIVFRANGPDSLVSAATAGLGLAALPCLIGDAEPSLERVDDLGFGSCDLLLVTHEQIRATPRVRAVSDWIAAVLADSEHVIAGR
jgi:DNA-binding transcriptional LysR family regulator